MFSLDVCHVLQFYREVLAEQNGNKMKQNETERLSRSFKHFSPVYKIEEVDSEHLEPLSSINLGMHKVRQEQLEHSGQLSMNETWRA